MTQDESKVVELKIDALHRAADLVKTFPKDDSTGDLMFKLAVELYYESDIDIDQFAEVLRIYADWLQNYESFGPRRHGV